MFFAPAGSNKGDIVLKIEKDPNCDASQGPCKKCLPGDYMNTLNFGRSSQRSSCYS